MPWRGPPTLANSLEAHMNDVLALLLSINEDPTVDFTYRLSALKALRQIEGRIEADTIGSRDSVEAHTTAVALDQSTWCLPAGHRFSQN